MTLDADQLHQFDQSGYVVLPAFLDATEVAALRPEVDAWTDIVRAQRNRPERTRPQDKPPCIQLELPCHGQLIGHPRVMAITTQLMGTGFAYHHLHTARHDPGTPGVPWHHDYEQHPQTNRSHVMVHFLYYLDGLDGTIGDLLVLPRSHKTIADRNLGVLGQGDLPGMVVVDAIPPGSAVLVHSALWHARRAKPGGENRLRYFVDCSYCQAGVQWPSPYPWWRAMLQRAIELGLDRGGRHAHLFDPAHFYDTLPVYQRWREHNRGSVALAVTGDG